MLESELFALLERTGDAAYSVTDDGTICSWSGAAERLFGWTAAEAEGRNVNDLLEARDALGTDALASGAEAATRRWDGSEGSARNFDLEVTARGRGRIWVNVSTLVYDNPRTGRRLFVRLARDITRRRQREERLNQMLEAARQVVALADEPPELAPVDVLTPQETTILRMFARGSDSATIARTLAISGQTLRNHLHRINRKLRTHTRLEAVTHAQRRGLLA